LLEDSISQIDTLSLEDFLRLKKAESESKGKKINWENKKQIWLTALQKLYNTVNIWLNSSIKQGLVEIRVENHELREDYIGSYSVKEMTIQVGFERVFFKPKGVIVLNAAGRVDLIGEHGSIMLLLLEKNQEFQWHIAVRTGHQKPWPLTQESFADALKQVMSA